jgi:hypothetical protein
MKEGEVILIRVFLRLRKKVESISGSTRFFVNCETHIKEICNVGRLATVSGRNVKIIGEMIDLSQKKRLPTTTTLSLDSSDIANQSTIHFAWTSLSF